MFKKLFTLSAAALFCASTYAANVVEDYYIDWKTSDWNFYVMGYIPTVVDGILTLEQPYGTHERVNGEVVYTPADDKDEDGQPDAVWYQLFVASGIGTSAGQNYTVTVKIKASEEVSFPLNMGDWGDGNQISQTLTATTEWSEQEVVFNEMPVTSAFIVAQPGVSLAKIEIEWIKVTHVDDAKPLEWIDVLTNGDAEGEDNSCFFTKNYGEDLCNTVPEEVDGGHAYVVHAGAKQEQAWDNQFFIQVPEEYALVTNDDVKISFRYKAAKPAKASTQIHSTPTNYMHWMAIGDVNFTTEWQTFNKTLTPSSDMNGGRTIAFNLNELEEANDYYFDDITWSITPTEDGWFVAGDFQDWDLDNTVAMTLTEDESYVACVGTDEKPASVVKISTKRGNNNAFNTHCIKIKSEIVEDEALDYEAGSTAKITLPEEGIWIIEIYPEYSQLILTKTDVSGISVIDNDNAPAVYYNIQGMQVANPTPGQFYIVKKGNNVSKRIIR